MTVKDVRIPDIGDAEDVEVVEICVAVGDRVALDGPLIVIESDKASMEVPSPVVGRITRIDVRVGDHVEEGQVIAAIETEAGVEETVSAVDAAAPSQGDGRSETAAGQTEQAARPAEAEPTPVQRATTARRLEVRLPDVGEAKDVTVVEVAVQAGATVKADDLLLVVESDKASMEIPSPADGRVVEVRVAAGTEVAEGDLLAIIEATQAEAQPQSSPESPPQRGGTPPQAREGVAERPVARAAAPPEESAGAKPSRAVHAGPAVRRQARELGVDLAEVKGTGARGRIVKEDVQAYVKAEMRSRRSSPAAGGIPPMPVVDFSKYGPIETVPLSRIRRRGAENLQRSWLNVVHVTQHDEADVTELEAFRSSLKAEATAKGVKLTPLAFIVKALIAVLKAFPQFNASLDRSVENLILKRYFHIGFAVDTPDGLVVPVLRDADGMGVYALAAEIEKLSAKAREGKLAPAEIAGGTFSVSSLGPIGGTAFTPIVNAPEVAILGVSRLAWKPHWNGQSFEPRQFLPVSLSYDHRAINGAEAGRFVTELCATLADVRRVLL